MEGENDDGRGERCAEEDKKEGGRGIGELSGVCVHACVCVCVCVSRCVRVASVNVKRPVLPVPLYVEDGFYTNFL